jgi:predicted nucleic-acid-binding Zn-ribbon protein
LQIVKSFTVDLTEVRGRGDVKCPRCGARISPDDKTEDTYAILEAIMEGENLEKIAIQCNKCKSQIHLTGFHILNSVQDGHTLSSY